MPSKSTYLSRFSSPREVEPKEGHLQIFKWHQWPNVDGANSLSWNFINIPVNQVIQPLFLSYYFLAEFPSGMWVPSKSTYLPQFLSPHEMEPKEGHLPIFKWHRWPNVDGANSLSWNFIGIPRKPSYSAPFSLLLFSGQIPIWCMGTHQAY